MEQDYSKTAIYQKNKGRDVAEKIKEIKIGIQTFEDLIRNNYIYIDKTDQIYNLVKSKGIYFLSRPRRFGKSLLISTIKAIFEGKKELFEGLAIYDLEYDWKKYPVVALNMPTLTKNEDYLTLQRKLQAILSECAKKYGFTLTPDSPGIMFRSLIDELYKLGPVAVLVDEYDRPILDVLTDSTKIANVVSELHGFYSTLKDKEEYLRFIFIAGVGRFSKTSIFSGFNNLDDLSLDEETAALLGYTDEEIDLYFATHLKDAQEKLGADLSVRELLREWYNGYKFNEHGPAVYNPFSVMNMLKKQRFDNYWFSSGTPTFLISLIRENSETEEYMLKPFDHLEISQESMSNLIAEKPSLIPLLYQTGYITLESFDFESGNYTLKIPNYEIHRSLFRTLLSSMVGDGLQSSVADAAKNIRNGFNQNDLDRVRDHLKIILTKIAYSIQDNTEKYYHSLFYLVLTLAGCKIIVEEATDVGRIDAVVTTKTHYYIIELKVNRPKKPAEDPIAQIKAKKYYEKYHGEGKKIVLVGVVFDITERTVIEWAVEPLDE